MIYKAQSPAGFAEEYIVESIWSGRFPPGTILPAERELSELIGVTRTTLREVLQRLARDGWLTIQHGKPTKVNNYWDTCGVNILQTLARLDQEGISDLIDNLLAARTNLSAVFIRGAIKNNAEQVIKIVGEAIDADADNGKDFAELDYQLSHDLAFASGNKVFVLTMNGFRSFYSRIGGYYFSYPKARQLAIDYYKQLLQLAENDDFGQVYSVVRNYGVESGAIWHEIRTDMPNDLVD